MIMALLGLLMVFLAGLIRGFTGFGFSIAAVPLLSLLYPPAEVVPVVMLLQLAISLDGLRGAWALADRASLGLLSLGALLATPLGLWGLAQLPPAPVRLVIAGVVALAVVILAGGRRMTRPPSGGATLAFGLASGLFNGLAGIPGPPVIAYYLASPLATATARASMIVLFLLTSLGALLPLAAMGMVGQASLLSALLGLPAVWAGSWLGTRMFLRSPDARYRRVALAILGGTALLAVARVAFDSLT
ncbi:sulfite exporter TauE/SafE family protein [Pseudoroseomonas sp. WGS1072]|uniref:sulfite exporter TauE/SafE family protein n=1 Tax=Roseomonas sp. WGS1072 TaxID=3366816 RepID=UPI003BEF89DB